MTAADIARILLEEVYKYSSTQIMLPDDLASFVLNWNKLNIADEDLHVDEDGGKGRETEVHITLKYGLRIPSPTPALRKIIETTPQFLIELGAVSLFESEEYDVVKLDVLSPELHKLNARIAANVPNDDTHPNYRPHLTLAYCHKGTAGHLVGQSPFGAEEAMPSSFNAEEVTFTGAGDTEGGERVVETIPLMHERPEKPPADMAYRVVWADGRAVQYFGSHEDALRFSQEPDRDADAPKLVRRPKGEQVHEAEEDIDPKAYVMGMPQRWLLAVQYPAEGDKLYLTTAGDKLYLTTAGYDYHINRAPVHGKEPHWTHTAEDAHRFDWKPDRWMLGQIKPLGDNKMVLEPVIPGIDESEDDIIEDPKAYALNTKFKHAGGEPWCDQPCYRCGRKCTMIHRKGDKPTYHICYECDMATI